jgi:hypothetical protein
MKLKQNVSSGRRNALPRAKGVKMLSPKPYGCGKAGKQVTDDGGFNLGKWEI